MKLAVRFVPVQMEDYKSKVYTGQGTQPIVSAETEP